MPLGRGSARTGCCKTCVIGVAIWRQKTPSSNPGSCTCKQKSMCSEATNAAQELCLVHTTWVLAHTVRQLPAAIPNAHCQELLESFQLSQLRFVQRPIKRRRTSLGLLLLLPLHAPLRKMTLQPAQSTPPQHPQPAAGAIHGVQTLPGIRGPFRATGGLQHSTQARSLRSNLIQSNSRH